MSEAEFIGIGTITFGVCYFFFAACWYFMKFLKGLLPKKPKPRQADIATILSEARYKKYGEDGDSEGKQFLLVDGLTYQCILDWMDYRERIVISSHDEFGRPLIWFYGMKIVFDPFAAEVRSTQKGVLV